MNTYDIPDRSTQRGGYTMLRARADETLLRDLIAVLSAKPGGLRRWSVMQAMRTRARTARHELSIKFEDDVERMFRAHCVVEPRAEGDERMFFRPKEKAGEVWAVDNERAQAWLDANGEGAA